MIEPILNVPHPVTLVGGGEATPQDLHKALTLAPVCVAVDGGADIALATGVSIAAVIGDFDSIPQNVMSRIPADRCHQITEQDSTDFEKALMRVHAPVLIGVGFLGGRVDHQLAAFHTLVAYPNRPCVLLGAQEVICLAPPSIRLPTGAGDIVSLFPMTDVAGRSTGLHWPIDGLQMAPDARSGTSNRALGPMLLEVDAPGMLLILPRRLMPDLVSALGRPEAARWPARAG
jgi:thiamine pyrophosphokinase